MMSNGAKYQIPRFQRDYTWEQEQWEDLWSEVETLPQEQHHYMDYVVLQRKSQHDYAVIDGQQRLVTVSLIILAAIKHIDNLISEGQEVENNKERLDELHRRFIGAKNLTTLSVDNTLSLNRNNDAHFRKICACLRALDLRGLTNTNKLISQAFNFFLKKDLGSSGEKIAAFIEQLSSGMVFTRIVVQDELNAYKVFETLNARGVQLSTPDLLKNYLFSIITKNQDVPDNELTEVDNRWSEVVTQLGESDFTNFLRYHHNFQSKSVTKKNLFASVRKLADAPKKAYAYLHSLERYAPVYASLSNPDDDWWHYQNPIYLEAKQSLDGLRIFNIKQPFTILMTAFFSFTPEEFVTLCRYMLVLSIRYNVICHLPSSEQENKYNRLAMRIDQQAIKCASHVKNSPQFKELYPDDDTFRYAFAFHKMSIRQSPKKIRFLFAQMERRLGNAIRDMDMTTLAHIYPYNSTPVRINDFGEGYEEVHDRLGNMLLLPRPENKQMDTATFAQKKVIYAQTRSKLAAKVADYEQWNKQAVME